MATLRRRNPVGSANGGHEKTKRTPSVNLAALPTATRQLGLEPVSGLASDAKVAWHPTSAFPLAQWRNGGFDWLTVAGAVPELKGSHG